MNSREPETVPTFTCFLTLHSIDLYKCLWSIMYYHNYLVHSSYPSFLVGHCITTLDTLSKVFSRSVDTQIQLPFLSKTVFLKFSDYKITVAPSVSLCIIELYCTILMSSVSLTNFHLSLTPSLHSLCDLTALSLSSIPVQECHLYCYSS